MGLIRRTDWVLVGDGTPGEQTQRSYESLSEASDEDGESEDETYQSQTRRTKSPGDTLRKTTRLSTMLSPHWPPAVAPMTHWAYTHRMRTTRRRTISSGQCLGAADVMSPCSYSRHLGDPPTPYRGDSVSLGHLS